MSHVKTYKPSFIQLGYAAGHVLSVLKPYIQGKTLELTTDEVFQINRAQAFLDSALRGCDINKDPSKLFDSEDNLSAPSNLSLVMNIFLTNYQNLPKDLPQLEKEIIAYRSSLEKLKNWVPLKTEEELASAKRTQYFFEKIGEWSDTESYKFNN